MKPDRSPTSPVPGLLLAALGLFLPLTALPAAAQRGELPTPNPDLPPEFHQLLPRGAIASVDAPQFVPAAEARIPDDAWVLGVEIGGEARAYSLNLLNHHEVVNDKVGGTAFAAVW